MENMFLMDFIFFFFNKAYESSQGLNKSKRTLSKKEKQK